MREENKEQKTELKKEYKSVFHELVDIFLNETIPNLKGWLSGDPDYDTDDAPPPPGW